MNVQLLVACKRQALTQEQLAEKTGISQPDISRIEKYGWTPPFDLQQKLATALGLSADELFGGREAEVAS